jgi:Methyltransferase small domain
VQANLQRLFAPLVPNSLKRVHESWSNRRFVTAVTALTREYLTRNDPIVRDGPFAGMRYVEEAASLGKLVGAYERELQGAVEELIATAPDSVIDVGCAEGYYAIGFARRLPQATVYAFDVDQRARQLCAEMARLNGVQQRVRVEGRCSTERLGQISDAARVALFLDCEGCEMDLLSPDLVPGLRRWPILVELHEFLYPDAGRTIGERFENTHRVELIEQETLDGSDIPELTALPPRQRRLAVDEHRPAQMRWALLRPRSEAG